MIDFGKILKRAWHILWNYKVLWIFGILLALTTGGGGSSGGNNSGYRFNGSDVNNGNGFDIDQANPVLRELATWFQNDVIPLFEHPSEHIATFIWIGVAMLLFFVVMGVISALIRYPSEVAVMRMVNGYEENGEKVGFRAGWKLGWNRRAFRLWVIDLIIGLPAFLFFGLMLVLGILFFVNASETGRVGSVGMMITTIGCLFLALFIFIIVMVFLSLLREFFARFASLEETGVIESFRHGWAFFKQNWKSAGLMWLIMIAIGIGYAIIGIMALFLFVPLYVILLIPAALVAAIPGLRAFGIASIFISGPLAWIIGILFALPAFFTVLFAPLFVLDGWFKIYSSSVWTLAYREMKLISNASAADVLQVPAETA